MSSKQMLIVALLHASYHALAVAGSPSGTDSPTNTKNDCPQSQASTDNFDKVSLLTVKTKLILGKAQSELGEDRDVASAVASEQENPCESFKCTTANCEADLGLKAGWLERFAPPVFQGTTTQSKLYSELQNGVQQVERGRYCQESYTKSDEKMICERLAKYKTGVDKPEGGSRDFPFGLFSGSFTNAEICQSCRCKTILGQQPANNQMPMPIQASSPWGEFRGVWYKSQLYHNSCYPCCLQMILRNRGLCGETDDIEHQWEQMQIDNGDASLADEAPDEAMCHRNLYGTDLKGATHSKVITPEMMTAPAGASAQEIQTLSNQILRTAQSFLTDPRYKGMLVGNFHAEVIIKAPQGGFVVINPFPPGDFKDMIDYLSFCQTITMEVVDHSYHKGAERDLRLVVQCDGKAVMRSHLNTNILLLG